ncbi:bifunctional diaminohydroxyphosphoribosylaminopyrimidine deaminase/5-amino-6-(5-phosphoribosylamino)uracil reductase RibD [Methylicorpusculum sp.]|uniref:bifunctional diaminohydroxyphosphoribosylaminopyrimidine deaminase/5-amino-6-(5-phosphoribosylamino)uracil reductase RibD n=1 Tax=Methylicorpusculum sp. TaxID=2713644 RepID=UPI0027316020|nr:bifunctional diaminohydroxyphosphoribosylaminopyrimidine deaminase/5-amino-6-(5-phosphoribosylamino)uracil reductase RibD [Methylicorpusculum sp.]MDP2177921.1 bifunctional diaminohydroxyphosphoribosylaminopyrimidine deaminase/5-amino-6-(5-phosphoribosylamino)uracil reductase RibD [Methylicorpusculum sp.]MDP3528193.1 bifunctional diaminohydroxyphosphoribosylaminopyrimidine deaminase/5-amino-6-(5-phosphoribosylamino)uracil reductase RibD [Methylicorpusculum sp.]MDZ4153338.1 bifunctional diamino
MARAIKLAQKGLYTTDPNPRVGCVFVKEGQILGEGWHQKAGEGHAEVEALKNAGDVSGATAYVTLEPCSHHGKTPPCAEALINAKVARVVVAMQDPNPLVSGRGISKLRAAGIEVRCHVLEEEAQKLNPGFIKRMKTGLPYVRSKLAMSLDGRTALANGESKWITSPQARSDVHKLRARSSAIMTGINTVLADDPQLNARIDKSLVQPLRVILDSRLRMPVNVNMLKQPGRTLVLTCCDDDKKARLLEQVGCEVVKIGQRGAVVDISAALKFLGGLQINELLIEAGAILNGALLNENCVDEWIVYQAMCVLGDKGRGLFSLPELTGMAGRKQLKLIDARPVGPDLRLSLTQLI